MVVSSIEFGLKFDAVHRFSRYDYKYLSTEHATNALASVASNFQDSAYVSGLGGLVLPFVLIAVACFLFFFVAFSSACCCPRGCRFDSCRPVLTPEVSCRVCAAHIVHREAYYWCNYTYCAEIGDEARRRHGL